MRRFIPLYLLAAAAMTRCGDSGATDDCDAGAQACRCLLNACFNGLMCVDDLCVPTATTGPAQTDPPGEPTTTDATAGPPTSADVTSSDAPSSDATSSDTTSTNADDTTSATTEPPPVSCGDGKVDPGEPCDDGNAVDDDACSDACKLNVPRLELVDEMMLPVVGTPQGEPFVDRCGGIVHTGLGMTNGLEPEPEMSALAATCKTPRILPAAEGYAIKFESVADLPWRGQAMETMDESPCGPTSVPTGYGMDLYGPLIRGFYLFCQPVFLDGDTLTFYQLQEVHRIGSGSSGTASMCPEGWIVVGHHGHADSYVNSLGIVCARPVIKFD